MTIVKVSPKYQIVIPKSIREKMQLKIGQKMQLIEYDNRVECIPVRKAEELKGFLKGMDTKITRDKDRL